MERIPTDAQWALLGPTGRHVRARARRELAVAHGVDPDVARVEAWASAREDDLEPTMVRVEAAVRRGVRYHHLHQEDVLEATLDRVWLPAALAEWGYALRHGLAGHELVRDLERGGYHEAARFAFRHIEELADWAFGSYHTLAEGGPSDAPAITTKETQP